MRRSHCQWQQGSPPGPSGRRRLSQVAPAALADRGHIRVAVSKLATRARVAGPGAERRDSDASRRPGALRVDLAAAPGRPAAGGQRRLGSFRLG